ncbi:hypothetical protein [Streptomyces sp. NPDC051704]|uniref:hypothetical protein n=1 Tax=Streptomyces sp. NPDC051704 TaxID=3365671 RepID=UPI0037B1AD46
MPRNPRWLVALAAGAAVLSGGSAVASAASSSAVNPAPFSTIVVDRSTVAHGESFTVSASRFWPNEEVYVRLVPQGRADDDARALQGFDRDGDWRAGRRIVTLAILLADANGEVSGTVRVPERHGRHLLRGEYQLELAGHGSQLWQSIAFRVLAAENGSGEKKPGQRPREEQAQDPRKEQGQEPREEQGQDPREEQGQGSREEHGQDPRKEQGAKPREDSRENSRQDSREDSHGEPRQN